MRLSFRLAIALGLLLTSILRADEPPVIAVFADGAELRGPVSDLADPTKAAVAKRPLFAAGSPVRWTRISAHPTCRS